MSHVKDHVHLVTAPDVHLIVDVVAPQGWDHDLIKTHDTDGHVLYLSDEDVELDTDGGETGIETEDGPGLDEDANCPGCTPAVFGELCNGCALDEGDPDHERDLMIERGSW